MVLTVFVSSGKYAFFFNSLLEKIQTMGWQPSVVKIRESFPISAAIGYGVRCTTSEI